MRGMRPRPSESKGSIRPSSALKWALAIFLLLSSSFASAGNFRVFPLRLEFDARTKSGVFNLINEGGEDLRLQLEAREWTQDEEGKDTYTETSDIVFFPKILKIEEGNKRIVRVGIKRPPAGSEKTYRLFMEEIPVRSKGEGTKVSIAVRLGVPIFLKPLEEAPGGGITDAKLTGGELGFAVNNRGNVHLMIKSIGISGRDSVGEEVFSRKLSGWYLLDGASRSYATSIPEEVCAGISTLAIGVKTDGSGFDTELNVDKSGCSR